MKWLALMPGSAMILVPCLALASAQAAAVEDAYTPPTVPRLYEKTPPEDLNVPPITPRSHIFTGGGVFFGQSRSTGAESPRAAYGAGLELGYANMLDSWSRLETSFEILTGSLGHSEADVGITAGLMARVGYGYNLASGVTGVMRLGVGGLFAKYSDELGGIKRESVGQTLGTAVSASYLVNVAMSRAVSLRTGFTWTHMAFQIGEVEAAGVRTRLSKPVGFNLPALEVGLRMGL